MMYVDVVIIEQLSHENIKLLLKTQSRNKETTKYHDRQTFHSVVRFHEQAKLLVPVRIVGFEFGRTLSDLVIQQANDKWITDTAIHTI
jgi:hypothetical protein